jgi:hypothetical protein
MSEQYESQDLDMDEEDFSRGVGDGGEISRDGSDTVGGEDGVNVGGRKSGDKGPEKLKRRRIKKFTMSKKKNTDKAGEQRDRGLPSSKRKTVEPQIYDYFHDNFAKSKLKHESIGVRDWEKMASSKEEFLAVNKYDVKLCMQLS